MAAAPPEAPPPALAPPPQPLHNGTADKGGADSIATQRSGAPPIAPQQQLQQQQQQQPAPPQQQQQQQGPPLPPQEYRPLPSSFEADRQGSAAFPGKVPRPPAPQAQRFLSGQSISQQAGPTPTLNSLLQAGGAPRYPPHPSHPQHAPQPYDQYAQHQQQGWPQRPLQPYAPQPYRNPPPGGGSRGTGAGGYPPPQGAVSASAPAPAGYAPYAQQRYPAPPAPASQPAPGLRPPYSPHQYEQGPSPQPSPGGAPHSPGHAPSASPQPPHSPHAHQNYPPRPGQASTPNAHDSESELTGQNSNDSSSGGGGGPPVRPSPSPTGSGGSRSMSPAVGQQSVPMPPRPSSSSQAEGGGAAAGGRPSGPGVGAGAPSGPPVGPPPPPAGAPAQPPYHHPPPHPSAVGYKMPPHHQPYPPPHHYPQGNYPPRPPYPNQGYGPGPGGAAGGPGAGGPGAAAGGQYGGPGRPQYPPYGAGWGGAGARPPPPPPPSHYLKQQQQQHPQHKAGPQHMGPPHHVMGPPSEPAQDNGLPGPPTAPATALVTTGPDGAPLDDGSQQSTLSNASAASGEEPPCAPRGGRGPAGGAPSPGAASHAGPHEDYDASPSTWPRTPSSPVYNSHVPQETYRTKQKSDSLGKLYEMDESPERRGWVERLLNFMEERRTPIAACPTISKQPLDLYRLYLLVRDRGGFVEVTKNKTWKDIAGMLGIGASSSAAYTLRKHYTKNLLAYECHFDRGGIDPQPIINQVEATTKKKSNKNNSVPSPGSSNSQDSFPGPGGASGTPVGGPNMDGYGPPYSGYPPSSQPQPGGAPGDNIAASNPFEDPQPRHAAPPTPPAPHRNHQPGGYPGQQGYGGYDQYGSYPPNRPVYPPYGPEQDNRSYPSGGATAGADPYGRYGSGYAGARGYPPPAVSGPPGGPPPAPPQSPTPPPAPPQDYYRPPGSAAPPPPPHLQQHEMSATVNMNSQLARQLVAPLSPGAKQSPYLHNYGGNKAMPPPAGQPRRHPDFAKEPAPQPPYPTQRPQPPPHHQYGAWGNNSGGQYRGQYPPATGSTPPGAQWGSTPPRPPPAPAPNAPWGQPYQQPGQQPWGSNVCGSSGAPGGPLRPGAPPRPTGPYRPDLKQFPMPPSHQTSNKIGAPGVGGALPKREIIFPSDSVEAVTPITFKRRRLTKNDVAPIEAWRLMMALKSGLLAETCWALDVLNILLFDDSAIGYFGLQHLPGLLDLLLEHFQKSLADIFDCPSPNEDTPWYLAKNELEKPSDIPAVSKNNDVKQLTVFMKGENYTTESRKGKPVIYKSKEEDLFAPDEQLEWETGIESVEVGLESWQFGSDNSYINHVMPCFQGEFINIPFARVLEKVERTVKKEEIIEVKSENVAAESTLSQDSQGVSKKSNGVSEKKNKRTKATLAEILSRVKGQASVNCESKINGESVVGTNEEIESKPPTHAQHNGPAEEPDDTSSKNGTDSEDNFKSEPMEIEKDEKIIEKPVEKKPNLKINDPAGILKRKHFSDYEDECYTRDEASLFLVTESQDALARRCICLSNILRNLTFVPGNETEFSKSGTFLALMGKLLLLHHEHPVRAPRTRNYDKEEDAEWKSSCSSLQIQEWWWDFLAQLREDALVCCANIGGQVDLGRHSEQVARPVLDGLLHWAVCPSAGAQDPLPAIPPHRALSPRRLALEALCKLCVTDSNVDLVVATPPFPRLERLCSVLAKHLCRSEDQVLREFSVNLLHYLAAADSGMARTIAAQNPTVSLLVAFIEQAEQSALGVANQHGIGALRDNPDSMGTSLDMLRRAAGTLLHLARHPDNKPLFIQQEQRLLSLVMSQILDQKVAAELSKVLFQCSRHPRNPSRND